MRPTCGRQADKREQNQAKMWVGDPTIGVALQSFPAYGNRRCPPLLSVPGPIHIDHQSRKSPHTHTCLQDNLIETFLRWGSQLVSSWQKKTNQSRSQGPRQGLEGELEQRPWWNTVHWLPSLAGSPTFPVQFRPTCPEIAPPSGKSAPTSVVN